MAMSREEALRLPVTISVPRAGKLIGIGRSTAYEMARQDTFPPGCLIKVGKQYRVLTAPLLRYLGLA